MRKPNKKILKILLIILAVLTLVISFFAGFFVRSACYGKKVSSLQWAVSLIEEYGCYYDEETESIKEFTAEDYANAVVQGLLDKYSAFYTKEEMATEIATDMGNYYGVGVSFLSNSESGKVFTCYLNSPAYNAGIRDDDEIVGVTFENQRVNLNGKRDIIQFISTMPKGEEFEFFIKRADNEFTVALKRDVYSASYVLYYDSQDKGYFYSENGETPVLTTAVNTEMDNLDGDTAYIRFTSFEGRAAQQLKQALDLMKTRGKTKLIFDLRRNGGGFMTVLTEVASYLTYKENTANPVVAVTIDKYNNKTYHNAVGDNFNREISKICVLADENTASASECLIGAMICNGKSFSYDTLVIKNDTVNGNATTYGKGIMQTTYTNYLSGEGLKITTARVYWPDEQTCIHAKGIKANPENSFEDDALALERAKEILR